MSRFSLRPWKTLTREIILRQGKYLTVEKHAVQLPDGGIIPDWSWVIIPDAVNVVAITEDGQFLCFRQTKYAVDGPVLAPVGGMLEPGEAPLEGARRELLEEVGGVAPDWINLGSYIIEPNRGIATVHFFIALNTRQIAEPESDDLEDQEIIKLSRQEVEAALQTGAFKILIWTAIFSLALNHLDSIHNPSKIE